MATTTHRKVSVLEIVKAALSHVNCEMRPLGGNTLEECRWLARQLRAAKKQLARVKGGRDA